MTIIDLRGRPPTRPYLDFFIPPVINRFNRRWMGNEPAPSYQQASLELFFKEMDEAGVTQTVCTGRAIPVPPGSPANGVIPNSHIHELTIRYPDRFIGVGGIDPTGEYHDPIAEMDICVKEYGFRAVEIEPGRSPWVCHFDDRRLYPIYERCVELGIAVWIMAGPMAGPDLSYTHPARVQKIAIDFPGLPIVLAHGCWPLAEETVGVAFKHDNVHVSPDVYSWGPGHQHYVDAANGFMRDQFLFGSAYPFAPLKYAVDRFMQLGLNSESLEAALYKNAQRLLRIEDA